MSVTIAISPFGPVLWPPRRRALLDRPGVRVEVEIAQLLLGGGETRWRILLPGPGRRRAVDDNEQPPARPHRLASTAQHGLASERNGRLRVKRTDEVEPPLRERPSEVVALEADGLGDTAPLGLRTSVYEGHARDIHCNQIPCALGEPHGVITQRAAEVERATGVERSGEDGLGSPLEAPVRFS